MDDNQLEAATFQVGFDDFCYLLRIDEPEHWPPSYSVRLDGVWIDQDWWAELSPAERLVLDPKRELDATHLLPFPCSIETLLQWLDDNGVGQIANEVLVAWMKLKAEAASAFVRVSEQSKPQIRWPWGTYETKKLRALADAAERFWVNYDPSDLSTAVNNADVEKWLIESRLATARVAAAIATILRADGLPTGRKR